MVHLHFLVPLTLTVTATVLLFASAFMPIASADEHRPIDGIIMPGIYMEELDDSVAPFAVYDRVVPLVFEFKVPPALTLPPPAVPLGFGVPGGAFGSILPRLACKNENHTTTVPSTSDWLFTCPIFYHVNQLLGQFRSNWTVAGGGSFGGGSSTVSSSSSSYSFSTSSASSTSSAGPGSYSYRPASTFAASSTASVRLDDECRSALRSWRGIDSKADVGIAAYKAIIEKCAVDSYFEEGIQDHAVDFTGPYEKMREGLTAHFGTSSSSSSSASTSWSTQPQGQRDAESLIGILLGIQNLMTTQATVESQRWRDAATACQAGLVPTSILRPAKLERALQELRIRLLAKKYSLLFSGPSSARLYKLKLVDCIFGSSSVFVQVHVPIVRETALYKSLSIHQPHFLYGADFVCYVASNFEAKGSSGRFENRNYIFEKSSRLLLETNCGRGSSLCRFPDKSTRPTTDGCLLAVLLGNMESIRAFCHLECDKVVDPSELGAPAPQPQSSRYPQGSNAQGYTATAASALGSNSFPLIQRIDSDKFIVTLATLSTLLIKCEAHGVLDELLPPQKYGALEVILPCGCYLSYHAERYAAYEPCSSLTTSASVHHVIPVHMINSSIEVPVLQRLNSQQIMNNPAALSGSNVRYNMNTRLRYLQPRNRITFPNITLLVNMTFRETDIVEVVDDDEKDPDEIAPDNKSGLVTPGPSEATGKPNMTAQLPVTCSECRPVQTPALQDHPHGALWALLATQAFAIGLMAVFIVYKIRSLERRVEGCGCSYRLGGRGHDHGHTNGGGPGVGAISFSASHPSQVTLTDKF